MCLLWMSTREDKAKNWLIQVFCGKTAAFAGVFIFILFVLKKFFRDVKKVTRPNQVIMPPCGGRKLIEKVNLKKLSINLS